MKASKILKRALALLLGLIVYFSVASPTEAYAAPAASTDQWIITVPSDITAGTTDPNNDKVTISGTWEPSKTVTVTSDTEIIMTCDTIPDIEVTAKVNFPADGLHTLSKHGTADEVTQTISVEAPNVLLGVWTGTINYQVTTKDFAPQSITMITPPDKTEYIEGDDFNPAGMQLKVVYGNGAEEIIDVATNDAVTLPTEALKCADTSVTVSYGGSSVEVPVTVVPKLIDLEATDYQDTYAVGDTFDPDGMIVTVSYMENDQVKTKPVVNYTINPSTSTALTTADTKVTITYEEYGQTVSKDVPITVKSLILLDLTVSGDFKKEYYEGNAFDKTNMVVTVKYRQNGTEYTKDVDDYTISPSGALTTTDNKVTITYVEEGQTLTEDVTITVLPVELVNITVSGTYKSVYGEEDTFDPTGMVVTASYTDGSTAIIPLNDLTIGEYDFNLDNVASKDVNIPISYTEDGVTRSATASVEVRYYPQMTSESAEELYGWISVARTIEIRDDGYVPTWTVDDEYYFAEGIATPVDGVGAANDIMLYVDCVEEKISIVGNGSGKIFLPRNSFELFYMGENVTSFTGLELMDSSRVVDAYAMFSRLKSLEYLKIPDTWDTSNMQNTMGMFQSFGQKVAKNGGTPVLDVSAMDFSGILPDGIGTLGGIDAMFNGAGVRELDLSNWVLPEGIALNGIFWNCEYLETIYVSYDWNENDIIGTDFFEGCTALVGGNGTVWSADAIDDDMLNIDRDGNPGYFTYKAPSN